MFTKEESDFIEYWEARRQKRGKVFKQMLWAFPAGALVLVVAIFLNFFSGWYQRATMIANANTSLFMILFIAGIIIVAFATIFASNHRWDINETRYRELMNRK